MNLPPGTSRRVIEGEIIGFSPSTRDAGLRDQQQTVFLSADDDDEEGGNKSCHGWFELFIRSRGGCPSSALAMAGIQTMMIPKQQQQQYTTRRQNY